VHYFLGSPLCSLLTSVHISSWSCSFSYSSWPSSFSYGPSSFSYGRNMAEHGLHICYGRRAREPSSSLLQGIRWLLWGRNPFNALWAIGYTPFLDKPPESVVGYECEILKTLHCNRASAVATGHPFLNARSVIGLPCAKDDWIPHQVQGYGAPEMVGDLHCEVQRRHQRHHVRLVLHHPDQESILTPKIHRKPFNLLNPSHNENVGIC